MLDYASIFGTLLAIGAILGGQWLQGGHLGQMVQGTAGVIVLGGTLGATLLAFPMQDIRRAFGMISQVYHELDLDVQPTIDEIVLVANVARKEGVLAIEGTRGLLKNPLFKKSIKYVIDGFEHATVRDILDTEIQMSFDQMESASRVFEGAGGYAPTIGILGAVLGLIHVMSMLNDPSKIGEGLAVAFVAIVYGVGFANLLLIPWSSKLKRKASQMQLVQEVVKLGVIGIQEGLNPHFLQEKLEVYVENQQRRAQRNPQEKTA